jgi:hypothetical protein
LSEEAIQESNEETRDNSEGIVHPFDRMFFGNVRGERPAPPINQVNNQPKETDDLLSNLLNNPKLQNIDYDKMMNHVDNLFNSLNELKPMFQKVSPIINKFLQKDK